MSNYFIACIAFFMSCVLYSHSLDTLPQVSGPLHIEAPSKTSNTIDPLSPSRAAFYSAVVPGLGQAYNKSYWKIPIVYAGIGTSVYLYFDNKNNYDRYRDAYKRRLAGYSDDEFQGIATQTLLRAQRNTRRNMDVSIAFAIGFYVLNIIDANVDAHLKQFNLSDDLSLQPLIDLDPIKGQSQYGITLKFNLK